MQNKVKSDESGITIQFSPFDQSACRNWCNYDTSEAEGGTENINAAMDNGNDANYIKIPDGKGGGMCHAIQSINESKGNDLRLSFRSDMISSPSYYVQGHTYTISAYLKAPPGTTIQPVLEWTSTSQGVISIPQSHIELTTANMTDEGYYRYHITATPPAYDDVYFMWMTLYVSDAPISVGDIALQIDKCQVNPGELDSYRPGGFMVALPVGIAANHEKFGAIKSATLYYNMSSGSDLVNADHTWYSDINIGQGVNKSLYHNHDVPLSASAGNYTAELIPLGASFANLDYYHLLNIFRPAFHTGITRTIRITKVEIDFYGV
jgi:hypothetical protein